jgi:hypothetical protein
MRPNSKQKKSKARDGAARIIIQKAILWISLITIAVLVVTLFRTDFKVPQKTVILKVDIKNRVNICLPESEKEVQEAAELQ